MLGPTNFVLMEVTHRKSKRARERERKQREAKKYKTLIEYSKFMPTLGQLLLHARAADAPDCPED